MLPYIATDALKYHYLRSIFFRYLDPKADVTGSAAWTAADVVELLIVFAPYLKPALENPRKFVTGPVAEFQEQAQEQEGDVASSTLDLMYRLETIFSTV